MSIGWDNKNWSSLAQSIYMGNKKINAIYVGNKKVYPVGDGVWRMFQYTQAPTGYYGNYTDYGDFVPCYIDSPNVWYDGSTVYCSMPKDRWWIPGESNERNGAVHFIFNKINKSWTRVNMTIIPTEEEQEWIDEGPDEDGWIYEPYLEPPSIHTINGETYCYGYSGIRKFNRSSNTWYVHEFDNNPFENENYLSGALAHAIVINGNAYIFDFEDHEGFYKLVSNTWVFIGSMGLTQNELDLFNRYNKYTLNCTFRTTKRNCYLRVGAADNPPVWKVFNPATETWSSVTWTYDNNAKIPYLAECIYEINGVLYYITATWGPNKYITVSSVLDEDSQVWHKYELPFDDNVPQNCRDDFGNASSDEVIIWTDGTNYYRSNALQMDENYNQFIYCQMIL